MTEFEFLTRLQKLLTGGSSMSIPQYDLRETIARMANERMQTIKNQAPDKKDEAIKFLYRQVLLQGGHKGTLNQVMKDFEVPESLLL